MAAPRKNLSRAAFVTALPNLLNKVANEEQVKQWSFRRTTNTCLAELKTLRNVPTMYGDASHLKLETMEEFKVDVVASTMKTHAT